MIFEENRRPSLWCKPDQPMGRPDAAPMGVLPSPLLVAVGFGTLPAFVFGNFQTAFFLKITHKSEDCLSRKTEDTCFGGKACKDRFFKKKRFAEASAFDQSVASTFG